MAATLMRNESATEPTAMPPISRSEKRNLRPKRPLIAAPRSGSKGTSQMYLYIRSLDFGLLDFGLRSYKDQRPKAKGHPLPFQQINLVYPDRFFVSIKRDHNS